MVDDYAVEVSDDSEDIKGDSLSIKEIILRQIRKIGDLSCKEFTGGYWQKKPVKTGSGIVFTEVYHEDRREAYCNAVDFLIDIIYPMSDDDLKEYLKKFEGFEDKITKEKEEDGKDKHKPVEKKEEEVTKDESKEVSDKEKIKLKLKLKRQTFRQINIMFDSNDFWKGIMGYNE